MKLDKPETDEIERPTLDFSLREDVGPLNVSFQELLLRFQSLAGRHVELLGIGKEYSERTKNVFVLCRERIHFPKPLAKNENYTLVTYPLTPGKLQMQREAYLLDSDRECRMLLDSIWVLVDFETRRMKRTNDVVLAQAKYPAFSTFTPLFEEKLAAIGEPTEVLGDPVDVHQVTKEDLDVNDHMNNTVYLKLVQPYLNGVVSDIEIDYEKECRLNETLSIYRIDQDGKSLFLGYKEDGSLSFKVLFTYF